jgi:hypothetical protein
MRPASQPPVDPFFEAWWKVVVVMSVVLLVGMQMMAEQPGVALFLVSIPLFAIPVAFLSAVVVWAWNCFKLACGMDNIVGK